MPFFSESSLKRSLAGKSLGHETKKILAEQGADTGSKRTSFLAKSLKEKDFKERDRFYKEAGFSIMGRKNLEKVIRKGKESYTKSEEREIKKKEEIRKRVNASISGMSSSEGVGSGRGFFGGRVRSSGFLGQKTGTTQEKNNHFAGFANSKKIASANQSNSTDKKNNDKPYRPLGLGSL